MVPAFVLMLITAPGANPYCAVKLLVVARNSSVASALGKGAVNPRYESMLGTPSSKAKVLPCCPPPAETPVSLPKESEFCVYPAAVFRTFTTPGDKKIKLDGSRPFNGNSLMVVSDTTLLISALLVFRSSSLSFTVTV